MIRSKKTLPSHRGSKPTVPRLVRAPRVTACCRVSVFLDIVSSGFFLHAYRFVWTSRLIRVLLAELPVSWMHRFTKPNLIECLEYVAHRCGCKYSLWPIILFANIAISRHILLIDTSVLAKSNMGAKRVLSFFVGNLYAGMHICICVDRCWRCWLMCIVALVVIDGVVCPRPHDYSSRRVTNYTWWGRFVSTKSYTGVS
jgi:hypothetical protein